MLTEITPEQERQWWDEMPKPPMPTGFSVDEQLAWLLGHTAGRQLQIQWEKFKAAKLAELANSETRVPTKLLEKVTQ